MQRVKTKFNNKEFKKAITSIGKIPYIEQYDFYKNKLYGYGLDTEFMQVSCVLEGLDTKNKQISLNTEVVGKIFKYRRKNTNIKIYKDTLTMQGKEYKTREKNIIFIDTKKNIVQDFIYLTKEEKDRVKKFLMLTNKGGSLELNYLNIGNNEMHYSNMLGLKHEYKGNFNLENKYRVNITVFKAILDSVENDCLIEFFECDGIIHYSIKDGAYEYVIEAQFYDFKYTPCRVEDKKGYNMNMELYIDRKAVIDYISNTTGKKARYLIKFSFLGSKIIISDGVGKEPLEIDMKKNIISNSEEIIVNKPDLKKVLESIEGKYFRIGLQDKTVALVVGSNTKAEIVTKDISKLKKPKKRKPLRRGAYKEDIKNQNNKKK